MSIFSPDLIKLNYYGLDKKSCLQEMVDFLHEKGVLPSPEDFIKRIIERENMMSTGIGKNIAIPHARSNSVTELKVAVFVLSNELEFDSIDGLPVRVIFMISVPEAMKQEYMKILSLLSNFCREDSNRNDIINSSSSEEAYGYLRGLENEI